MPGRKSTLKPAADIMRAYIDEELIPALEIELTALENSAAAIRTAIAELKAPSKKERKA